MIKVELEEREGIVRLSFTSNKGRDEIDILDAIGGTILTDSPKRGCYVGDTMCIDVLKPSMED